MGCTKPTEESLSELQLPEYQTVSSSTREINDVIVTVEDQRCGQLHESDVVVQSFGSVAGVVNDLLHGQRLSSVDRLLRQTHVHRPHGRVCKPDGEQKNISVSI